MKKVVVIFSISFVVLTLIASAFSAQAPKKTAEHSAWVARSLSEIQTIKVGMTRKDLLKLFTVEGGFSSMAPRKFVFRDCPYIKVDVEFQSVAAPGEQPKEYPDDKIIRISKPYLEQVVLD